MYTYVYVIEGSTGSWDMLLNGSTSHLTGEAQAGIQSWMLPCLEH